MKPLLYLRDAALYVPCYLLLDWVSYIHPLGAFNITPWNPQPALAVVWMLLGGLAYAPMVLATIVLADALIRHMFPFSAVGVLAALLLTGAYAGMAYALRLILQPAPALASLRQLTGFVAVVAGGSA